MCAPWELDALTRTSGLTGREIDSANLQYHSAKSGSASWLQLDKHVGDVLCGFMALTNEVGVPQSCALAYWPRPGDENYCILAVLDVMATSLSLSWSQCHIRDQAR